MGCDEHVHGSYRRSLAFKRRTNLPVFLGSHVVVGEYFEGGKEFYKGDSVLIGPGTLCCSIFKLTKGDSGNPDVRNTSFLKPSEHLFRPFFDDVDVSVGVKHEGDHIASLD